MPPSTAHGRPDPETSTLDLSRDGRPVSDRGDTVCVIGAGASGLTAIKNLVEHGFGVDCYERETGVGGAWNWRHDRSPVYASTHLVSSRPLTQFPDFPMPDSWPDYPHHHQLLSYLERYTDHFDLRRHIWFGTEVVRVEPVDGDRWDVTTRSTGGYGPERTLRYAAVVVANGHNWSPKLPRYDGLEEFRGEVMHASSYKDPAQLRGKRVLVVGAGNTGCDIAVEAAQQASCCWHSTRRGYWYAPKYLLGRPVDQVNDLLLSLRLPLRLRQWLYHRMLRLTVGDPTRLGLPRPDHRIYEAHPIANSQLVHHVSHGQIAPVPDVARFHGGGVTLTDGREIEPELVVFATGYLPRFEFLDPGLLGDGDGSGRPRLWLHAFPPNQPTLAVAGLLQPDSGVFTLTHWQTVVFARLLQARLARPDRAAAFTARAATGAGERYAGKVTDSSRHWFEVRHVPYLRAVQRALDELGAR
ncbi:NAD(P)/FAD-dependent oxidoreductase [Micromonospora sp. KC721]|uniref:flavin-containing monooxygenase n=1 Tax=Micromonospora sp. KC721 TaxID=2530380 RepID=UPI00104F1A8C|nr:NAD(P)-binding domain-containing protein [Micromonospora sp. KC721]TDB80327.1 monooxygenase [Micromonospora sp. KC721]